MSRKPKLERNKYALRENISLIAANKKESFDGMRAYHESEKSHLNNAIQLLWRSALPAISFPNFALLFATPKPDPIFLMVGSILVLSMSFVIVSAICYPAINKIKGDHKMYQLFGKDYAKTCEILHFLEPIKLSGKTIQLKYWEEDKGPGSGEGYKKSISILKRSADSVVAISFIYFSIIWIFNFKDFLGI